MRVLGVSFLWLCVIVSGCAGGEPASDAGEGSSVVTGTHDASAADLGSIVGTVVSEEAQPIRGAQVAISQPVQLSAVSDEAGSFRFEGLGPGDHSLHVSALGYEAAARKVSVAAGEATEVRFVLPGLEIQEEPFFVTYSRVFYIHLDVSGQLAYHYPTQQLACDPCQTYQLIQPGPLGGRVEMDYTPSLSQCATVGCRIGFRVVANPNNDTTGGASLGGNVVISGNMVPRDNRTVGDAGLKFLRNTERIAFRVNGYDVIVEQKVYFWLSFSYNAPMPDDFTALPPK